MHVASIWKKNARKKLNIHDWHIFFVLSVNWNQNTQLVRKPISASCFIWWPSSSNQEMWTQTTHPSVFFFFSPPQKTVQWPKSATTWPSSFFLHLSNSYQKSMPEFNTLSTLCISLKLRRRKKMHIQLISYLQEQNKFLKQKTNFVFWAVKLCRAILNYILGKT